MQKNQPQIQNWSRRKIMAGLVGVSFSLSMAPATAGRASAIRASTIAYDDLLADQLDTPLPDTPIAGPAGPLQLADLAGQPLLVNFWASWCAPCVQELPALEQAAIALARDRVRVLLVCIDRGGQPVAEAFLRRRGITLRNALQAYDAKASWPRALGLTGLPVTLWVAPDQKQAWQHIGPADWADPAALRRMRQLLAG